MAFHFSRITCVKKFQMDIISLTKCTELWDWNAEVRAWPRHQTLVNLSCSCVGAGSNTMQYYTCITPIRLRWQSLLITKYSNSSWLHLDQWSSTSMVGTVNVPLIQWQIGAIVYFMEAGMSTVVGEERGEEQSAHKQAFSDTSANSWKYSNAITCTCKAADDL